MWREARRGMDRFLHWHPGGGTTTSDFHFSGRPQGSLSYGYDNKRCFIAHNTLCLSICSTSLIILSWPVWLTCLVCCLWMADSDCLSVYFIVSYFVFQRVLILFCVLSVCLSEVEEELFTCLPSTTCLSKRCSVSWLMWLFTLFPASFSSHHRLPLYLLSGGSIECPPLCRRIAYTFKQSLNGFLGRSLAVHYVGQSYDLSPGLCRSHASETYIHIITQQQSYLRWSIIIWH